MEAHKIPSADRKEDITQIASALLKKGDKGDQVKALQQNLILLGYLTGEADGQFGPATKAAVTAFQAASGLRADGQAGEKTLEAIEGVESAEVSHVSGTAVVTLSAPVADDTLRQAVEAQDYKVLGIE